MKSKLHYAQGYISTFNNPFLSAVWNKIGCLYVLMNTSKDTVRNSLVKINQMPTSRCTRRLTAARDLQRYTEL